MAQYLAPLRYAALWCPGCDRSSEFQSLGTQLQESSILKEAVPLYEALDMPETKSFIPPDDGVKVRSDRVPN
jgi:hypothetical protein